MFRAPQLPRTLEAALRDVRSAKTKVRIEAARELVPHAEAARERVVGALEALLSDEEASVRAAVATTLGEVEGREAVPALLAAVEDADVEVRGMAVAALGEIGDPRATERLQRALSDERPEVRFQAAMAFPRVCVDRDDALEALLLATRDDDAHVVHIALRMAEELAGDEEPDARVLVRARALLGHEAGSVRIASAILTARADATTPDHERARAKAKGVLVEVARGELASGDGEDVAAAIELCGELGLEAARSGLERRAFGGVIALRRDRFAWHARVALARMSHERAAREILAELGGWTRDQRTLAVAAAGRARLKAAREHIEAMRGDDSRADQGAVDEALAAIDASYTEGT